MYTLELIYWHKDHPEECGRANIEQDHEPTPDEANALQFKYLKQYADRTGYNQKDIKWSYKCLPERKPA